MDIRQLDDKDAAIYWHLRVEALRSEPFAFGRDASEYEATRIEEQRDRMREMPEHDFILGGFLDGRLVATGMFIRETGRKERHKGHMRALYVSSLHRGKGFGRALVSALLAEIRRDRLVEQVLLGVSASQEAAFSMYRSFGFVVYGTEPRALKVNGSYVDENQMILLLPRN